MKLHRALAAGLAVAGIVLTVAPAHAQERPGAIAVRSLDTTALPEVKATVQYSGSEKVGPKSFTVRDGGRVVPDVSVLPIAETPTPIGVVLVVDTSGSMRTAGRLDAAKVAVRQFVDGRGPGERIAVVAFSDLPRVAHGFSTDAAAADAVAGLRPSGETALWDAVRLGIGMFADQPGVQPNVVVLSDGVDSASTSNASDAKAAAVAAHTAVSTIGLTGEGFDGSVLSSLASATGGRFLTTADPAKLGSLFGQIRQDLDQQFELRWRSKSTGAVEVQISAAGAVATALASEGAVSRGSQTRPEIITQSKGIGVLNGPVGLLLSVLLFLLAAGLLALGLATLAGPGRGRLADRLSAYGKDASTQASGPDNGEKRLASSSMTKRAVDFTEAAAEGHGLFEWVESRLEAARLPLRAAEACFFSVAFAAVGTVIALLLGGPVLGIVFLVLGLALPPAALSFMAARSRKKFVGQLPTMLQLLASSLRAGYSLLQGCEAVSHEIGGPMGAELKRVLSEARLGRPIEEALEEAARRMGSADFDWVVMAIKIQREVGGNLAELLDTVSDTMRARSRLRGEVKSLTAEGRISAIILGIMPPGLGVAMMVLSPGYLNPLFQMRTGQIMLGASILAIFAGFAWMQKIIKVDL